MHQTVTIRRHRLDIRTTPRSRSWLAGISLLLACAGNAAAQTPLGPEAPASAAEVQALRNELKRQSDASAQQLAAQQAALAKLQAALEAERRERADFNAAMQKASEDARRASEDARRSSGEAPIVRSGRFQLTLSGFVHVDVTAWNQQSHNELNQATGAPLNQTLFQIRRARLRAEVNYRFIGGAVEFDGNTVNGYSARIIGAEASIFYRNPDATRPPYLQLTAGSFKIPYGFEIGQSDKDRLFIDRSQMERALFPGEYDLGVRLQGGWRFFRYAIAAMNGDPIGERLFPGRDPNQSKDVVGRVGVDARIMHRLGIAGGFSAVYGNGFHKGTPETKPVLTWSDSNQDNVVQLNEISNKSGSSATPSKTFGRWAVGGDLRVGFDLPVLGELMLYGELSYATNMDRGLTIADPIASLRSIRELGWYAAFTQELTPWAQIGVRYDYYNPDRDANDLRYGLQVVKDPSYSTIAATVAARFPGYARLIAEYDHNTNSLGRTLTGEVTTLKSDAFIIRCEAKF